MINHCPRCGEDLNGDTDLEQAADLLFHMAEGHRNEPPAPRNCPIDGWPATGANDHQKILSLAVHALQHHTRVPV